MSGESASAQSGIGSPRLPPYSDEAEKGVLGSVLQDAAILDLCIENQLSSESFYVPANRIVYEALLEMSEKRRPIDVLTVADKLRETGRIEKIGGDLYVHRLIDSTPTTAHAGFYIETVRQKHILRRIIGCARDAENDCYKTDEDALSLLGRVEQSFFSITDVHRSSIATWPEMLKSVMTQIDKMGHGGDATVMTGFSDIDRELTGLRPGNMIVLAARPSMGKTSLAINMAENMAMGHLGDESEPKPVGIFSLEMSREDLVMRMLCTQAEVSAHKIRGGYLRENSDGHRRLVEAADRLTKAKIYLDDSAGMDVMELRARARRMKHKYDIRMFVIDYLQLLHSKEAARQGRQIETSAISGCLKGMAKELNVPVVVLSQLSRAPDREDRDPRLADLRDSGAIEQDADVVLLLRRPCMMDKEIQDKRLAIVDIAKNRNGPVFSGIHLDFNAELTRFSDRKEIGVDGFGPANEAEPHQYAGNGRT